MYRIIWHNRWTGGKGESDILYTSKQEADEVATQADKDNKDIIHVVVPS